MKKKIMAIGLFIFGIVVFIMMVYVTLNILSQGLGVKDIFIVTVCLTVNWSGTVMFMSIAWDGLKASFPIFKGVN